MDDTEAMLFVDNHQAEIFKLDILLEQPVGSNQNVDAAPGGLLKDLRDFLRG